MISPFFHHLFKAYQAELDDLATDSEGNNILNKRLAQRRKETQFLLNMLELSPEMVAVVFYDAFRFSNPRALQDLLGRDSEDLPDWDDVHVNVELAAWAEPLVNSVLGQDKGAWFMSVAVALEFMRTKLHQYDKAGSGRAAAGDDEDHDGEDSDHGDDEYLDEDEREAREQEAAGNAWLTEQGFDSKD
ncbi:hypothetical protein KIK84_09720 [Curvibacter sp. CHRR-16]|uniref:hypothetical protein n=1 Tax=Curvibacter sp. CHRR-16 TaxID=2835872 RepID=UPI001BDA48CC|nr:hypothetical protein [Curvibacter sp. CHRR-16]MBT0570605.1 hypothetical protein [Curvibacter sp. CHRR-16]